MTATAITSIIHEIDPNADAVVILKNPNASFASWSLSAVEGNATTSPIEGSADTRDFDPVTSPVASSCGPFPADHSVLEEEIHYRVSSRHLTLSSPRFESMLSGGHWEEGVRNEVDGLHHITTEDWDMEALLILLEILHHRNRRVPRTISLDLLAKLAVLIDYYECAEALELFTKIWVQNLKVTSPVPSHFCRDLLLWMCIAWVLRLPDEFSQTTTVAIRRDSEDLPTLGLPIVTCVARIEDARLEAISTVFSQLQELTQEYRSPLYQCPSGESFECGSILYGALIKEMEIHGLFPAPTAPFVGWSINKLYTKLRSIRSPFWNDLGKSKRSKHPCDLSARVMTIADPVTRHANGPKLEDFELIDRTVSI